MFDATSRKFSGIRFEKLNFDADNVQSQKKLYNINGIPHLVFLDNQNKVIYNGGAPDDFEGLVKQFQ
ncbi:MAG: hypothetical protein KC777_27360 [Cyanobacteria bacterium HKST-UBA02]|nr:hypothetical protein [Cyanobacteria bacterium HKST-UBA02]